MRKRWQISELHEYVREEVHALWIGGELRDCLMADCRELRKCGMESGGQVSSETKEIGGEVGIDSNSEVLTNCPATDCTAGDWVCGRTEGVTGLVAAIKLEEEEGLGDHPF